MICVAERTFSRQNWQIIIKIFIVLLFNKICQFVSFLVYAFVSANFKFVPQSVIFLQLAAK